MKYKYFEESEFECPCCQDNKIKPEFVERLDAARFLAGVPFGVESGYRCPKHNLNVGGEQNSAHLTGYAADIRTAGSQRKSAIVKALITVGFTRIGINNGTVHVDMAEQVNPEVYPANVMWDYY